MEGEALESAAFWRLLGEISAGADVRRPVGRGQPVAESATKRQPGTKSDRLNGRPRNIDQPPKSARFPAFKTCVIDVLHQQPQSGKVK